MRRDRGREAAKAFSNCRRRGLPPSQPMTERKSASRQKSTDLFTRAQRVIPGGVNSPVRAFRSVGGTPVFMESGEGCFVLDVDGNRYLDFCNSWGPLISGHRPPAVVAAVRAQCEQALTFGTPCEGEVLLAEFLVGSLAKVGVDRIRFVSSGTEAVMSALRLARGFTKRSKVIKFDGCYHGHSDSLLVKAGSGLATFGVPDSAGVPPEFTANTIVLPLDDEAAVEEAFAKHPNQIAAVILEPVPANNGLLLQRPEYLNRLREITKQHGSLLIFDEVISGFRIGFGGAAVHYQVQADLYTYGKIIGGGMPVGAFAGRAEIFTQLAPEGPVYQAGTLSGNPVAMAAGLAQLMLLDEASYQHLEFLGKRLEDGINSANLKWKLARLGSIFWLYKSSEAPRRADQIDRATMEEYAQLHRHCLERGVYLAPSGYEVGFLSTPMQTADIERLVEVVTEFFRSR